MNKTLEDILNPNLDYEKYILKILSQQIKNNEALTNVVSYGSKFENSKFFVFGKNSQHNYSKKIKKEVTEKSNQTQKRIYNSLTKHVYFTQKVKENLEKKNFEYEQLDKNNVNLNIDVEDFNRKIHKIMNPKEEEQEKNLFSSQKLKKKKLFQINNLDIISNIKPKVKHIAMDYFDSKIIYNNYSIARNNSVSNPNYELPKLNNFHTKENYNKELIFQDNKTKVCILNSELKQK